MVIVFLWLAGIQHVFAQKADKNLFNHVALGLSTGTDGLIGFDVAMPIGNYVQMRLGMSLWPGIKYKTDVNYKDGNGNDGKVKVEGKLSKADFKFLFDVFPFKKSSFHVTAGAFIGGRKVVTVKNLEPIPEADNGTAGIEIGDYFISTDKNGYTDASIKVNAFKPYVGFGFGRSVPQKHRFAVTCDFGVQFWASPKVYAKEYGTDYDFYTGEPYPVIREVRVTSSDVGDKDSGALKTISKISVWPVLNIRFCGRIL